tara:strand:- start:241 stop:927 length:687 start_codon:yes stop_codon:yes gene_type:complete
MLSKSDFVNNAWARAAHEKMVDKPAKYQKAVRQNAFRRYQQGLESASFMFDCSDLKNVIEWHKDQFSETVAFTYMFLDCEDDDLAIPLYIGKTRELRTRVNDHKTKEWYKYATNLVIEVYYDDEQASIREAYLIDWLAPLFNKEGGGLGMSFQKDSLPTFIPQNNNVNEIQFLNPLDCYNKYKRLGADTKMHLSESLLQMFTWRYADQGRGIVRNELTRDKYKEGFYG